MKKQMKMPKSYEGLSDAIGSEGALFRDLLSAIPITPQKQSAIPNPSKT
jgi:hypothetical protein